MDGHTNIDKLISEDGGMILPKHIQCYNMTHHGTYLTTKNFIKPLALLSVVHFGCVMSTGIPLSLSQEYEI